MKSTINILDVVRYNSNAAAVTSNPHAKDYIGIVKEVSDRLAYIEWYDCRSKDTTREVSNQTGWILATDLDCMGSFWHIMSDKLKAAPAPVAKGKAKVEVEPVKTKRKYVRKPGAAKPGPKPKVTKVRALDAKTQDIVLTDTDTTVEAMPKGVVKVPVPVDKYGHKIDKDWLARRSQPRVIATGKFKHFPTRPYIEKAIVDSHCKLTSKIDWCMDFAIVGEKPGPAKIQKFKSLGIPMITEEQWMALTDCPGFEFETTK